MDFLKVFKFKVESILSEPTIETPSKLNILQIEVNQVWTSLSCNVFEHTNASDKSSELVFSRRCQYDKADNSMLI